MNKLNYPTKISIELRNAIMSKALEAGFEKFRLKDFIVECVKIEIEKPQKIYFTSDEKSARVLVALYFETQFYQRLTKFCKYNDDDSIGQYFIGDFINQSLVNNWEFVFKSFELKHEELVKREESEGLQTTLIKMPPEVKKKLDMIFWKKFGLTKSQVLCKCIERELDKNDFNFMCEHEGADKKVFLYIPKSLHERFVLASKNTGVTMAQIAYKATKVNFEDVMKEATNANH